jgi:hypothetical protein
MPIDRPGGQGVASSNLASPTSKTPLTASGRHRGSFSTGADDFRPPMDQNVNTAASTATPLRSVSARFPGTFTQRQHGSDRLVRRVRDEEVIGWETTGGAPDSCIPCAAKDVDACFLGHSMRRHSRYNGLAQQVTCVRNEEVRMQQGCYLLHAGAVGDMSRTAASRGRFFVLLRRRPDSDLH